MPVTFYDQQSNQGSAYVDPAFRYDSSPRLLTREQYQNNADINEERSLQSSSCKTSRMGTPVSEYKRAYSRTRDVNTDNEGENIPVNMAEVDEACYETTTVFQDGADKMTSDLPRKDICSGLRDDIRLRDYLANKAFYTTSTQKLYQGVDWHERINPSPAPPKTSKELNADTVSYRYETKRYEPRKENWQVFGSRPFSWDYAQTRDGHLTPGPVRFCSPHRKITHLPGYMGHVSGGPGEMDDPKSPFNSRNKLRTLQPKYTNTARKGNIPGYTGCVLFCDHQPAGIHDPEHLRSTAACTYRPHNEVQCNIRSPFKKSSPMSRMVTLTYPYNPFNKVC